MLVKGLREQKLQNTANNVFFCAYKNIESYSHCFHTQLAELIWVSKVIRCMDLPYLL